MLLQLSVSIFVAIVLYEVWFSFKRKELTLISLIFWVIVWAGVLLVVWFAQVTLIVAHLLNIQRGIDSVVYLSIVILFYLMFRILVKIEKTERKVEKLVRKISMQGIKTRKNVTGNNK